MPAPAQLFKYRAWTSSAKRKDNGTCEIVNHTERLLQSRTIFCQKPRGFDDPHDSHTGAIPTGSTNDIDRFAWENMAAISAAMRKLGMTSITQLMQSTSPEAQAALRRLAGQQRRRDHFVACFSATGDDDLMWTFYADQHRGLCLEFDGTLSMFAEAQPVMYAAEPPAETTDPTVDPLVFHKATSWAFQEEWRILTPAQTLPFPPEALVRVILGYRFPEADFSGLTAALIQGKCRVVIDQMQRRPGSYQLIPVRKGKIYSRRTESIN